MEEHAQRTEGVTIVLVPPNTVDPTVKVSVIIFSRVRFLPRRVVILFALKELFTFVLYLQLMNVKSVTSTRSVLMDIVDVNMDIMATATNAKKEASTVDNLNFNLSLRNKKSNYRNNILFKFLLPIHQIPLGCYPFKGNLGVPTDQRKFGPSEV